MDINLKKSFPNPWGRANIISKTLFLWIIPLIRAGFVKSLSIDHLPDAPAKLLSQDGVRKWQKAWDIEKNSKHPKFWKVFFQVNRWTLACYLIILAVDQLVIRVMQPIYLRKLVQSFSDNSISHHDQAIYGGVFCLCALLHDLVYHQSVFLIFKCGLFCRTSVSTLLYEKSLRILSENRDIGQLLNLLSNDLSRFDYHILFIPYTLIGPFQLIILTFLLFEEIGLAAFVPSALVFLLLPAQALNLHMAAKFRRLVATQTDNRSRLMNEIVTAIRLIKTYAWEKAFSALVNETRRKEITHLGKRAYLTGFFKSLYTFSARFSSFLVILVYVLLGNQLVAEKVFFSVAISQTIMEVMIFYFSNGISGLAECIVSISRVQKYLLLAEQSEYVEVEHLKGDDSEVFQSKNVFGAIRLDHVSASWPMDENRTLNDISLDVKGDQLVVIGGSVGSGKTSLLHLLMSEIPLLEGRLWKKGKISYAPQEAWIFSGNVRQNVLFGEAFNAKRYNDVITACALKDDFNQLPHGDLSFVGERGVTLSGGQKCRIGLARSLYREGDVYLMDDPLSSVDSKVGRIIFEEAVQGLLKGKLRILVTHQLQYLGEADHVVLLKNGVIHAQGKYNDLIQHGVDFMSISVSEAKNSAQNYRESNEDKNLSNPLKEFTKPEENLEKTAEGSVNLETYLDYITAGESRFILGTVTFLFLGAQIILTACEYWLSFWTDSESIHRLLSDKNDNTTDKMANSSTVASLAVIMKMDRDTYLGQTTYLLIYSALILALYIFITAKAAGFYGYSLRISSNIHNRMFKAVVRAPTKFFDDNSSGRIMNRFTKDIGTIDELLPTSIYETLEYGLQMFGVVIVICVSNYFLIIPSLFILVIFWMLRLVFIKTSRDIRRLESIWKSPLFSHVSATLQGLTTVRAFGSQQDLIRQFNQKQDVHTAAWFAFISVSRAFACWVETIGVLFLTLVTFSFIILSGESSGGILGLVITSTLGLTVNIQIVTRQSAETENHMTSHERALEYSRLPSEASLHVVDKKPPSNWPNAGEIKFQNVFLHYENNMVLHNLSFEIHANEKIGIVGRTGAGKSSIISALFRLTEPQGSIFIDGVLINEIGLHDLRENISLIPQDPVLFAGTMRYNLDPFQQFNDEQLWQVLEEVQLKDAVSALECLVLEGGSNFSVGQRQLVCLARAILRQNKIIVLDEATSNVDPKTDEFIQRTIRQKFENCTIITIAHRLNTVMDCDRILVLEQGRILEYDHPFILLQKSDGILAQLANQTGRATSENLKEYARVHFETGQRESTEL